MDKTITASMVFVSSFESKSGNTIETVAKRIAVLRYGEENVPKIVNPRHIPCNIDPSTVTGQIVVTDVDSANADLRGEIAAFRQRNMAHGSGKNRVESGTTQYTIHTYLNPLAQKYKTDEIHTKPVDLAFFDGDNWNIMEIKAGGDLDSSNAPSNVEKLLNLYVDMGIDNCLAYFATLYNKDGEGNQWKGIVKAHLNYPSMFLIGSQFWNRILPEDIDFSDFVSIYQEALMEIDLNKHINDMIKNTIEDK